MTTKAKIQNIPAYIGELRSNIGYYLGWIPDQFADQPTADNYHEVLKKDGKVAHAMHLLSLMTAGTGVEVKSVDPFTTKLLEKVIKGIHDFTHVRKSLVEKSVLFGLGVQKKYYTKKVFRKFGDIVWEVPYRIQEVDRRRLRIEREDSGAGTGFGEPYWTIWSPTVDAYVILEDKNVNPYAANTFQDYIWYIQMQEEMSPYFDGFGGVLYSLVYLKQQALKYWGDLAESWSKPFAVVSIDLAVGALTAALGDSHPTLNKRISDLLDMIEKMRARHCLVVDNHDKVEYKEGGSTGNNIIMQLVEFLNREIQLLILGAELVTSAATGGAGSFAQAQVHQEALDTVILYNRSRVEEVLIRQLIWDFFARNRSALVSLGYDLEELKEETEIKIISYRSVNQENAGEKGEDGSDRYTEKYKEDGGQPNINGKGLEI